MSNYKITGVKVAVPIIEEQLAAAAALSPGHLVELASATTARKHNAAGGNAARTFAIEDLSAGRGVANAYATGDKVRIQHFRPGDRVQGRVAAAAAAIVAGDKLESAGDGTLRKVVQVATSLTDSTTGTADDTVADVGATFNQGTLNNNFADLAAKVNALLAGGGPGHRIVGIAREAVDNSGGGSEVFIDVEIA